MPHPPEIQNSPFFFPIKRPVTITMIVLTIVVFGILSLRLLPINMMPPISYPSLTVRTEYAGSAPEEIEEIVTRPLEQALSIVSKLVNITSSSRAGVSDITLEFDWDTDMNKATQDVREKIDLVYLPDEVQPPLILRYDPNLDPLMRLAIVSDSLSPRELRSLGEDIIKRELEKLIGVAAVKVKGGEEVEVRVALDADKLEILQIPIELIQNRLSAENINIAGGRVQDGSAEYILRTQNEFKSIDEISGIIIKTIENNHIRLSDIATISLSPKEETIYTQAQGKPSVELDIYRESEINPITLSSTVQKRLFGMGGADKSIKRGQSKNEPRFKRFGPPPIAETLPPSTKLIITSDQSEFIKLAVKEVQSAALIGGLLAIIVLWFFLRKWMDTFIVALVIPISLACAFAAMNVFKVSINMMSLGGLALGIGMMVDNAIVVIESIYRRRTAGEESEVAAVRGTQIVGGAVIASTLTTLVVFFPIIFVTGIAGQIFGDLALTVVISLFMSLIVALFFTPMLAARWTKQGKITSPNEDLKPPQIAFKSVITNFINTWKSLIQKRLVQRLLFFLPIFIFAIVRLIIGIFLVCITWLGWWFILFLLSIYKFANYRIINKLTKYHLSDFSLKTIDEINKIYAKILNKLIKKPILIISITTILMALSYGVFVPRLGSVLVPNFSQGLFDIHLIMPIGTPLEQTIQIAKLIEKDVKSQTGVRTTAMRAGEDINADIDIQTGSHTAIITVRLEPGKNLEKREEEIIENIRNKSNLIPGLEVLVTHPTLFTFKKPIELVIRDDDLKVLKNRNDRVLSILRKEPYLTEIESTVKPGHPEVNIKFNRDKLALLNLSANEAAQRVKTMVHGSIPTKFREVDKRTDIRINLRDFNRNFDINTKNEVDNYLGFKGSIDYAKADLERLKKLTINPGQNVPVHLEDVADISIQEGPAEIKHIGSVRSAIITMEVKGLDIKTATNNIIKLINDIGLIYGIDYTISGQREEMNKSLSSLKLALALAIFLVYVVMASQFESFGMPFLILLTIPVSLSFVFPALIFFNIPLSVMVFLGLIVLVGIVVNNSIVLVDYIDYLRNKGRHKYKETQDLIDSNILDPNTTLNGLDDSIVLAAKTRLRPILMTTLTTILGLLPMVLGLGEGAEMRKPMAITVMVGLTFSLFVSLIFIPTLYRLTARGDRAKENL